MNLATLTETKHLLVLASANLLALFEHAQIGQISAGLAVCYASFLIAERVVKYISRAYLAHKLSDKKTADEIRKVLDSVDRNNG